MVDQSEGRELQSCRLQCCMLHLTAYHCSSALSWSYKNINSVVGLDCKLLLPANTIGNLLRAYELHLATGYVMFGGWR